jgi:aurora kinase
VLQKGFPPHAYLINLLLFERHPNIIRLFTWFHDENRIYFVLEFALNGSLLDKLNKQQGFDDYEAATVSFCFFRLLVQTP